MAYKKKDDVGEDRFELPMQNLQILFNIYKYYK